jgi:hypothetical protein
MEIAIKVVGGGELITHFASCLQLPLALDPACLAQTDSAFSELLRRSVTEPLEIKVRQFLQKKFEETAPPTQEKQDGSDKNHLYPPNGVPVTVPDQYPTMDEFLAQEATSKKRQ